MTTRFLLHPCRGRHNGVAALAVVISDYEVPCTGLALRLQLKDVRGNRQ
jgi:hypothetical protein